VALEALVVVVAMVVVVVMVAMMIVPTRSHHLGAFVLQCFFSVIVWSLSLAG
jgi:hypothetical protein